MGIQWLARTGGQAILRGSTRIVIITRRMTEKKPMISCLDVFSSCWSVSVMMAMTTIK